jgi:hypothetical protein
MLRIIFDKNHIGERYSSTFENINIMTVQKENENNSKNDFYFEKARNNMILNYVKKEMIENITEKEKIFLNELCKAKNITNCWVKFLDGKKKYSENGIFEFDYNQNYDKNQDNEDKDKNKYKKNNLNLTFNEKIKIILDDKELKIDEFKEICKTKHVTLDFQFMFYAIIYTTREINNEINKEIYKSNIQIKLKVTEIKILQLKDKTLNLFQVDASEIIKNSNKYLNTNYQIIPKFPTNKKKAIQNILQIVNK